MPAPTEASRRRVSPAAFFKRRRRATRAPDWNLHRRHLRWRSRQTHVRHRQQRARDVDDFYPTAGEAERTLAEILGDEPELEGMLWVEPVELATVELGQAERLLGLGRTPCL